MAELTAAHARDLGDYASLVRRRWTWVLGSVLVCALLAMVFLSVAAQTFVSSSKVLVKSTVGTSSAVGDRTNDAINLDTEAQLVTSEPVAERAGELLGTDKSPVALANQVTVAVPPNTTVLSIAFSASTAEDAQDGASAFAQAYLENRSDSAQDVLASDVDRLQQQIEQVSAQIEDTSVGISRLNGPDEGADKAFLIARRENLNSQLASYNAQLAPLVGTLVNPGEVITEAQLPRTPVDPNPMVIIPAGLMAGLVIGLALAGLRERGDKRIHNAADVERLFGIVPLSSLVARGRGEFVRIDHDVRAFYHSLRANGPERGEVALLVGPDAGGTAEHLSYSLAVLASRSGSPTAYLTRPDAPVLAERRRHKPERNDALDLRDYEKLGVMAGGEFRSSVLREELSELSETHDFLILGLPNDDPTVDLPILGRHVDVAVVVVQLGVSRRDTLAAVLSNLTKSGVHRVLVVTVDLRQRGLRRSTVSADEIFGRVELSGPRPVTEESTAAVVEGKSGRRHKNRGVDVGITGTEHGQGRRDGSSSVIRAGRPR
jgi:capsular polysaccharide biosynthesis protein